MTTQKLPGTHARWLTAWQDNAVAYQSIHTFTDALSASKIEFPQYILLRSLWKKVEVTRASLLTQHVSMAHIKAAEAELGKFNDWRAYLDAIRDGCKTTKNGSLALVRYYQHLCLNTHSSPDDGGNDKIDNSPMQTRSRTRPPAQAQSDNISEYSESSVEFASAHAQTASWLSVQQGETALNFPSTPNRNLTSGFASLTLSATRRRRGESGNGSNWSDNPENRPKKFQAVKDEQIVNTAIIILLNVLTISFSQTVGEWSLHRHPLCVQNNASEKVFEARVDGIFTVEGEIRSILEVKPYLRDQNAAAEVAVCMQETAQMAAWISTHPPVDALQNPKEQKYHRLMLAQDRHEIFVSVASFIGTYVRYICGEMDQAEYEESLTDGEGFLTISQQGPYDAGSWEDMNTIGILILAFSMQGCLLN
ncbi:hypothetical protein NLG97_g4894 [Lecanicillium saksenae]|uniref:Uncharacterized protein n=1 Tax=Lecanicillium saksenae TaxID=468837 RepID=A0ACC1QX82_9HYPO|nr:hypothetical protein NLG97_g4894 [Lecanicillium saksenae]